jgi:hypothetical protein
MEYELPITLVLTGKAGWARRELERAKQTFAPDGWLIETGYVPDEHLVWLYNAAEMLLYPSFYEGFGLPPLEAMACGTPVIASNGGALPEVVGSGGILLPPNEPGMWASAIHTLLTNNAYREALCQRAITQAQRFSWARHCRAHLASLPAGGGLWITFARIVDNSPPIVDNSVENPVENPRIAPFSTELSTVDPQFSTSYPHRNPRSLAWLIKHSVGRQKLQFEFKIAPPTPPNLSTAWSK